MTVPEQSRLAAAKDSPTRPPSPDFVIVWDTALIGPEDYARLVAALGDLVRASGGLGIERIRSMGYSVATDEEAT